MSSSSHDGGSSPNGDRSPGGDNLADEEAEPADGGEGGAAPHQPTWAVEAQLLLQDMDLDEPGSHSDHSSESSYSGCEAEWVAFSFPDLVLPS